MKDIQSEFDTRGLPLDMVGITGISLPLLISGKKNSVQPVSAVISFYASLASDIKGHHMSRFVEILYENSGKRITLNRLKFITSQAKRRLDVENAYLEVSFNYFMKKKAPVTGKIGYLDYRCIVLTKVNSGDDEQVLTVEVPIMLLCPCSKAISKYNAHNQRAIAKVKVVLRKKLWIEDIITLIEKQGSCEVYPVLKRPDEKYVTEKSYENAKFVEDIVRDIANVFSQKKNIVSFSVECESQESIHNHNAFAKYISL